MINKQGYYTVDDMLKENNYNPGYYLAFGEQNAGKTYSTAEFALKALFGLIPGHAGFYKFTYVRRYNNEIQTEQTKGLFDAISENGLVKKYSHGDWDRITCIGDKYYLQKWNEEKNGYDTDKDPCGYLMCLNTYMKYKGARLPGIRVYFFDEFISDVGYLSQEWNAFKTTISRIAENRTKDLWIFLMGNTIDMYCPYFGFLGIRKAIKQPLGTIKTYYNRSGIPIVVERTKPPKGGRGVDALFDFENDGDTNNSINTGKWQMKRYPICPVRPDKNDKYFTYWVEYMGEVIQADMYVTGTGYKFTLIHPHKGNIHDKMNDYHFGDKFTATPMYHRFITKASDDMHRLIADDISSGRVFYAEPKGQTGSTGNLFESYIDWCRKQ